MIPTETSSAPSRQKEGHAARWFAFAGVGGPILFVLVFTLAGFLRPGYSPLSQAVSDLGVGPNAWLQNANFVVFGLLLITFAIGFYQGMRSVISRGWLVACLVLLILSGVGIINGGIFTEDPTTVIVHWIGGFLLAFLSPLIVFFIAGWQWYRDPTWRIASWYSLITGVMTIALIASLFVFLFSVQDRVRKRPFLNNPYQAFLLSPEEEVVNDAFSICARAVARKLFPE